MKIDVTLEGNQFLSPHLSLMTLWSAAVVPLHFDRACMDMHTKIIMVAPFVEVYMTRFVLLLVEAFPSAVS